MITGILPGSFDPLTFGHIDIIRRAIKIVDNLVIAIIDKNSSKKNIIFSNIERFDMIQNQIISQGFDKINGKRVEVKIFNGLLVDFAESQSANLIIRGLRPFYDFGMEFKMSCVNNILNPSIETIFLASLQENQFISSSLVKEVASLEGDLERFLPHEIASKLRNKFLNI